MIFLAFVSALPFAAVVNETREDMSIRIHRLSSRGNRIKVSFTKAIPDQINQRTSIRQTGLQF